MTQASQSNIYEDPQVNIALFARDPGDPPPEDGDPPEGDPPPNGGEPPDGDPPPNGGGGG